MSNESSEGMLAGVKVLDVASFIAAPAATTTATKSMVVPRLP